MKETENLEKTAEKNSANMVQVLDPNTTVENINTLNSLSKEDVVKATELSKTLDITSDQSIVNFGVNTQKKLGDSSIKILEQTKTKDADEVGKALSELVSEVNKYEGGQNMLEKFLSNIPILNKVYSKANKIVTQHKNVEANIENIVMKLDRSRVSLFKDNANIKALYDEAVEFIKENNINIEAVKIKIKEVNEVVIPKLEKEYQKDKTDQIKFQEIAKMKSVVNRLEKKVHNMQLFNVSALQELPRLVMIQDSNSGLVENIQSVVLNVIPLWRNQIAEALFLERQSRAAEIQDTVYNMTNAMIKNNAESLRENQVKIAKHMERGIIDIETLEKVNKEFIATIDEVIKIKENGVKNRLEAERAIGNIKNELMNKIGGVNKANDMSNEVLDTEYEDVTNSADYTSLKND